MQGNIPTKYDLIWYSTSSLGTAMAIARVSVPVQIGRWQDADVLFLQEAGASIWPCQNHQRNQQWMMWMPSVSKCAIFFHHCHPLSSLQGSTSRFLWWTCIRMSILYRARGRKWAPDIAVMAPSGWHRHWVWLFDIDFSFLAFMAIIWAPLFWSSDLLSWHFDLKWTTEHLLSWLAIEGHLLHDWINFTLPHMTCF